MALTNLSGGLSAWQASYAYSVGNIVSYGNQTYICIVANTSSSSFVTDQVAGYWILTSLQQVNITATAGGTTTLTASSKQIQVFTGSLAQTVVLPTVTNMTVGQGYQIVNESSSAITLLFEDSTSFTDASGVSYTTIYPHQSLTINLQTNTTAKGTWLATGGFTGGGANVPTVQKFLTATSGTYTTPTNCLYIQVEMAGGGAGGTGSGTASAGVGTAGGATTFGTSLLTANGGGVGTFQGVGGTGGTASIGTGPIGIATQGGNGQGPLYNATAGVQVTGGSGGSNTFAGGGAGNSDGGFAGIAGIANTGGGGSGGSINGATGDTTGSGGGAGGYIKAIINNPASSYSYTVGAGGSGGTAGTSGYAGGAGGSGVIIVTEFYANGTVGTATSITGSVNSSQVLGATAVGSAPTGYIGEFISSNPASAVTPGATGVATNITSITLSAGDWDVEGTTVISPGSISGFIELVSSISLTSNGNDSLVQGGIQTEATNLSGAAVSYLGTGTRRVNVSTTTTVYLVGIISYSTLGTATYNTNSFLRARRVR